MTFGQYEDKLNKESRMDNLFVKALLITSGGTTGIAVTVMIIDALMN